MLLECQDGCSVRFVVVFLESDIWCVTRRKGTRNVSGLFMMEDDEGSGRLRGKGILIYPYLLG